MNCGDDKGAGRVRQLGRGDAAIAGQEVAIDIEGDADHLAHRAARVQIGDFLAGQEAIGLQGVMDDGQFTKFLMKKGADLPQFYRVLPDGTEAMVDSRREGDYMVVKRLASMFVLRSGNAYVCVENLANPYKRTVTRGARDGGGA